LNSTDRIERNLNVLKQFDIASSALKICYIGRHNEIKGYDFLQKAALKLWNRGVNAYFIIGGKEGPYMGLKDNRWIELGWVKTAYLLNEVDVFILPNQQTYFDLILLETLRQGTPIILSRTGGNKWFEQFELDGLFFFEYGNYDDLIAQIMKIQLLKEEHRLEMLSEHNRTFIKEKLNMGCYIEQYLNTLKILSKRQNNG
jgi:glycosyltransferase involved in cell wall biosynthesis